MKTKILTLLVAVALLAACKSADNKEKSYVEVSHAVVSADTVRENTLNKKAMLVKTAEMNFKVKNVQQTSETIVNLARQYNGMIMHHQVQSTDGPAKDVHVSQDSVMHIAVFNTNADMLVKLPSENLEDFMIKVSHLGTYVKVSKMDIEDKSLDYLSARMKAKNRRVVTGLQEDGKIKLKDASTLLAEKDEIVDEKLGNLRIDDAVKYSVVSLTFYQSNTILKEVVVNDDPSAYDLPLSQQLKSAFVNGWTVFMYVVVSLANLWMFMLLGLGVWLGIVYYKRKMRLTSKPAA